MSAPDKKRLEAWLFGGGCSAWDIPFGMHLPSAPPCVKGATGIQRAHSWLFWKRFGLGVLKARALMRFYFLHAPEAARSLACGMHGEQVGPDSLYGILYEAFPADSELRHERRAVRLGLVLELERWLVHASASHSVLMDAPAALGPLTPEEWGRQCRAHIEDRRLSQNLPAIWPPQAWPAYVVPEALRDPEPFDDEADHE
jgi:hypothetical protein